jgi:hypothetical protein
MCIKSDITFDAPHAIITCCVISSSRTSQLSLHPNARPRSDAQKSQEALMAHDSIRTTVTFPSDLLEEADRVVEAGDVRSRNDLVVQALRRELAIRERARIDAEFLKMADDHDFQAEDAEMAEEMTELEWEEFKRAERAP